MRRRRALRRAGAGLAALVVVLTAASWVFNRVTDGPIAAPDGLTYVRTGDLMTRVSVHGSTGPAVVLVPGAAESAGTWDAVAQRLSADHRVYAYDVVGWGYTQRRGPYDLDHATRQLLGLLDALGLRRPVLVGHSSGAAVVVEAALRAPQRVGGLLLLDGDALATGAGARSPLRHLVLPPFRTTLLRLAVGSDAVVRAVTGAGAAAVPAARRRRARRVAAAVPGGRRRGGRLGDARRGGARGVGGAAVPGRGGRRPQGGRVRGAGRRVPGRDAGADGPPDRRPPPQIIPDARHLTPVSDPDVVADAVAAFARGVPDGGP